MDDARDTQSLDGGAALEHLTGPSRGGMTWLSGPALDIAVSANRLLRVSKAGAGEANDSAGSVLVARLHDADGTYELTALEGQHVWVNGVRVDNQILEHRDLIEFGDTGPLSRFRLYGADWPTYKLLADIISDGLGYLRVSRQPFAVRLYRGVSGLLRRLTRETTRLFRLGVVLAIIAFAALAYQQSQLNKVVQKQIETGTTQLESFAGALARARGEALTPGDLQALRRELASSLSSNAERLAVLERRSEASARVIAGSVPSILFLQGSYGFRERNSGRMMRHIVDDDGRPMISPMGQPLLSLKGNGPVAERQFTGTGFSIGDSGALITNRHVALPWENDANVQMLAGQGLEPVMIKYIVYVPGAKTAGEVELVRVSEDSDLAVLRRKDPREPVPGLRLAKAPPTPGDEVIVMGYPTGLRSMLAQSGEEFVKELQKTKDTGFWSVAARLAEKGHIAPLASRGIVSQITTETIVYDAETTHGGSGGPVLDVNGAVVAVNTAILPEYGGSNLGVPVAKVRVLLEKAGLR